MRWPRIGTVVVALATVFPLASPRCPAEEAGRGPVHSVVEIAFRGPSLGPTDAPARDVELRVTFRLDGEDASHTVLGFWDGDGRGRPEGDVFKVRFCPTAPGRWTLADVASNDPELDGQHEGDHVVAEPSDHPGFWVVDDDSPGRRWYRRTDGSHPYIYGNTQYSFLSLHGPDGPTGVDLAADIAANARIFKKLRFSLMADRYPDPVLKPFLDDSGRPTDDGDFSHRPNPAWFLGRADVAVAAAFDHDLIADLILAGPDTEDSRATLRAEANDGDATPWLRYVAARYGSYPNVWICLCNEFDIKNPRYTEAQIARFGRTIADSSPYPTPLSVHDASNPLWHAEFDDLPPWADHMIIQNKLRDLSDAADVIERARRRGRSEGDPRTMPVIDDELSYQGEGDRHSEHDTIESHLGAFLGGGYGTTGEKPGNKLGQYFMGGFDPASHTAAPSLGFLRGVIDESIPFWRMEPGADVFDNLDDGSRALSWPGLAYALGTDAPRHGLVARLPEGSWRVTLHDAIRRESRTLSDRASGRFTFDAPDSRAALFVFRRLDEQGTSPDD